MTSTEQLHSSQLVLLEEATRTHSFLKAAAANTLDEETLALWLAQDKIYASFAYPRFIGYLITKLPPPSTVDTIAATGVSGGKGMSPKMVERIRNILIDSLVNIRREIDFFTQQENEWNFDLSKYVIREATLDYLAAMDHYGKDATLEEGMAFLWAMEKVYLDAWSHIYVSLDKMNAPDSALHRFARNWSTPEFVQYVDELAAIVDGLEVGGSPVSNDRLKAVWEKVLLLEKMFWPELP